ncbi:unnamed protein product [Commensalibacter communis]|uniref:hypothetical protein n=1 Tax=Commensalibacter communis TaxID=2972786 RepID=UPI0022FFA977|nr:hypothetical protein [Commensalibacter communis]CAI3944872.1 unnamed protein product [Commensalibacter communis]
MPIPTYLEKFAIEYKHKDEVTTMTLCSSKGNKQLEVWYYGNTDKIPGEKQLYITDTKDAPEKITVKDPATDEEILVFDGAFHGYDSMFCDEFDRDHLVNRPLKRYDLPASELILEIYYNIPYEEEKEEYDFDTKGDVILINEQTMSWEDVKRNGFDAITLSYINDKGERICFFDKELA